MKDYIADLIKRYPSLIVCEAQIKESYDILKTAALDKNKILTCGNGGSSSDSDHIVGELMKSFVKQRPLNDDLKLAISKIAPEHADDLNKKLQEGVAAINLSQHAALNTAFSNDVDSSMIFAQQVIGYGKTDDVIICISSSGNSKNVVLAAITAKAKNMKVVGLTGTKVGSLDKYCDVVIKVPEIETYKIQELHLPVYHTLCLMIEDALW
jgi:D-sedoheptulose 7-phosphate isomerase